MTYVDVDDPAAAAAARMAGACGTRQYVTVNPSVSAAPLVDRSFHGHVVVRKVLTQNTLTATRAVLSLRVHREMICRISWSLRKA